MYKVFKDNCLFILTSTSDIPHIKEEFLTICVQDVDRVLDVVLKYADETVQTIVICNQSEAKLVASLESLLKHRVAAGGWVYNSKNELLMIDRLKHYDIPKGHLEKGESLEQCAIREVEEETGIRGLNIVDDLGVSRHIFQYKKGEKYILKITHWYKMESDFDGKFVAQQEEGVEQVFWINKSDIIKYKDRLWRSLWEFYKEKF